MCFASAKISTPLLKSSPEACVGCQVSRSEATAAQQAAAEAQRSAEAEQLDAAQEKVREAVRQVEASALELAEERSKAEAAAAAAKSQTEELVAELSVLQQRESDAKQAAEAAAEAEAAALARFSAPEEQEHWRGWSVDEVAGWLCECGQAKHAAAFAAAAVDGPLLELLDGSALEELGVGSGLDRARLLTARVRSIPPAASRCKLLVVA